jgi:hypothetical protein
MQEGYWSIFQQQLPVFERTQANIIHRVREARIRGEQVLTLATEGDGLILPEIWRAVAAKDKAIAHKTRFDGTDVIMDHIDPRQPGPIELVGAFRDVCVLETWKGLRRREAYVLPVSPDLTLETLDRWKNKHYPRGYLL